MSEWSLEADDTRIPREIHEAAELVRVWCYMQGWTEWQFDGIEIRGLGEKKIQSLKRQINDIKREIDRIKVVVGDAFCDMEDARFSKLSGEEKTAELTARGFDVPRLLRDVKELMEKHLHKK